MVYPGRKGVTFPELSTLAVNGFTTVQVAVAETSCEEPSEYTSIAESFVGAIPPIITEEFAGVTTSDWGIGGPTVSDAVFAIVRRLR